MAILIINGEDFSSKLKEFSLACGNCGSRNVRLEIDWACYPSDSWLGIDVVCGDCGHDENIREF